jgi:hypothetical protein
VGLDLGPLSLVIIIEELLGRKSIGSGQETREYGRRDLSVPRPPFIRKKLTLISPTSGGRSVCIVRSWIQATEFSFLVTILKTWETDSNVRRWRDLPPHLYRHWAHLASYLMVTAGVAAGA